jgi:hypothetical protein
MLISMPTGTSTIFGVFQAIVLSFKGRRDIASSALNYRATKSSPVESFVLNDPVRFLQVRRPVLNLALQPSNERIRDRCVRNAVLVPGVGCVESEPDKAVVR